MKSFLLTAGVLALLFQSCQKKAKDEQEETAPPVAACNIQKTYADNAAKVTIANGVWGTVAFMEGNCMPIIDPANTTCKTCPVKRKVRIYEYTTRSQAIPQNATSFYDALNTQLVKEIDTDDAGFFQTDLAAGTYTVVVIENGKFYAFGFDGTGGISPINYTGGKQTVNLTLRYKAVF